MYFKMNYFTFQASNPKAKALSALDIWLLTCMLYVALALFEYSYLLNLRFTSQKKKKIKIKPNVTEESSNPEGAENDKKKFDEELKVKCQKVDKMATLIFAVTFVAFIVVYFAYFMSF